MKFIDIAIPKFDDGSSSPTGASTPPTQRESHASFRQKAVEEYVLDDTHSILSHPADHKDEDAKTDDGSSVDKGEKFYEARDDTTEAQRSALQQVTFEFSFSVGRLQTSLFRSVSPTSEKHLADASLEGFGLTFALRQYDMSVDLYLQTVILAMINQDQTRRRILSSADDHDGSPDTKLVRVRYLKVQKESPEFMTKHEGVDQSIDTELSAFKITVAPEPILSLYDFIMTTFVPKDEDASKKGAAAIKANPEEDDPQSIETPAPSSDKIKIRVKLTSAQGRAHVRTDGAEF